MAAIPRRRFAFAWLSLALTLGGCAGSNYNCKGVPEGVNCLSAREVYNATEYHDFLGPGQGNASSLFQPPAGAGEEVAAVRSYSMDGPIPIRTPEKVMKIWIGPWEDKEGSLHMPTVIFTEIEERRWVVGEKMQGAEAKLMPLDVRSRDSGKRTREDKHGPPADLSDLLNNPSKGEPQP